MDELLNDKIYTLDFKKVKKFIKTECSIEENCKARTIFQNAETFAEGMNELYKTFYLKLANNYGRIQVYY